MKSAEKIIASIAVLILGGATVTPSYAQDAEHGKSIFKACAACHATDHASRAGPGLGGIIGRKAGTVPGFSYSNAMKKSDIVWDTKIAYMESPQQVVPGNRMPYAGLRNPTDRT